ncbi:hypothetical protein LI951_01945 [Enterococcus sp. BWT-B8]|uniref:hypothetical protein n=1 Tax=unclassified Enterococcus TaxID=2608891 RepID=UPI001E2C1D7B|nr:MULTISPECIES: hypothetical protein [unclassified Enterococcus]MCB5950825.1 hypothetical protein [Enterococcus sp. BWT-B8]MCB5955265.1 hypothetical protein [Enterococcus sp. CWB-B31]
MYKKTFKLIAYFCISLFLVGCNSITNDNPTQETTSSSLSLTSEQKEAYKQNTDSLSLISPLDFTQKLTEISSEETIFVYFGRLTCSYCRNFVAELDKLIDSQTPTIYYIDTENTETDPDIQDIRDTYEIEFVPSFIKIIGQKISMYDSETDKLEDFINH